MPKPPIPSGDLTPREQSLCAALASAITNYRPLSPYRYQSATHELLDTDEEHAAPLIALGWKFDKAVLAYARSPRAERARLLKADPTLATRGVFTVPA